MRPNRSTQHQAALRAIDLFAASAQQQAEPAGALPRQFPAEGRESISLGSRRLCNDQPFQPSNHADLVCSVEHHRATFYYQTFNVRKGLTEQRRQSENLTRGRYNGYLSKATKRKLRRTLGTWLRSIHLYRKQYKPRWAPGRAYPVFLTVTLPSPQIHDDREIHRKCLGPFLQGLKRHQGVEHYFWRAEGQENGNIHYHILADRYIRKEDLQHQWNKAVNVLGYVDRYYEESGDANPPSTQIQRLREKVRDPKTGKWKKVDPISYLLEYVLEIPVEDPTPTAPGAAAAATPKGAAAAAAAPNRAAAAAAAAAGQGQAAAAAAPVRLVGFFYDEQGNRCTYFTRPIAGRVWGMSDTLRDIREPRGSASRRLVWALHEATRRGMLRRVDCDRATLFFGDVYGALRKLARRVFTTLQGYLLNVFCGLYPGQMSKQFLAEHPPRSALGLLCDFVANRLINPVVYATDSPRFGTWRELLEWLRENRPDHYAQALHDERVALAMA